MNNKIKILIIVIAAFIAFSFVKNTFFQTAIGAALSKAAHVPVSIGSTSVRFLTSSIHLKNIKFRNPKGFPGSLMVDIQEVFIDFDPGALFKGQAHFEEVKLNLKEVIVVKNREGLLNVEAVKPTEAEKQKPKRQKGKGEPAKLRIDRLYLTVGRVVYKDYSAGGEPAIQTFDVNIENREYRNIEDPSVVVSLIMFEALTRTTLSRLANLDVGTFKQGFSGGLDTVATSAGSLEEKVKGVLGLF
ncbi:MAG: AsmA family protein [Candidatus Omnitrophota bacterium]